VFLRARCRRCSVDVEATRAIAGHCPAERCHPGRGWQHCLGRAGHEGEHEW